MDELDLLEQFNALQNAGQAKSKSLLDYDLTGTPRDYSNDSTEDFMRSKEGENNQNLYANLMSVVGNMNKNLTGATPNTELVQGLRADAKTMGDMWKQQQEQKASDIKLTQANIDIDTEKDKANPASGVSNLYRNFIKDRLKINVDDNTSAAQLEKMLPVLRTLGLQGGVPRYQFQRIVGKDGVIRTVAINQNDPTDIKDLGESGFKNEFRVDPRTGDLIVGSGSAGTAKPLDRQPIDGSKAADPKAVKFADLKPKARDFIQEQSNKVKGEETFKGAEKVLSNIPTINALVRDALKEGGQSLSMLGPVVAKALAGETGVLTDQDVVRYVANPSLIGSIKDWVNRYAKGEISAESAKNLLRLTEIMEKEAKQKTARAMSMVTGPLSTNFGYDEASANHYVAPYFFPKEQTVEQLISTYAPEVLEAYLASKKKAAPAMQQGTSPRPAPAPQATPTPQPKRIERISETEMRLDGVLFKKVGNEWKKAQ